ncbi:hypothetical protein AVEN_184774-1 [Araneus ventricosus]|uniref:Uncharacterized protein n=1 Tax=Araneus ventricosus TaxID=182803 RepID=A0A4Y2E2I4_ARAVE|nr:hypothetical protein AVEN_98680-1 [Araneus ventricosus]GBM23358.1 hypothetical protein AVEN_102504-1 [Araneus ventricosus]GBM23371.1 hypothetical protein AVEN_94159-1 [Araneus ventricosus]GBM23401.1 hypothetical protein AVEN_184774-1 [Araneus ventricosus]
MVFHYGCPLLRPSSAANHSCLTRTTVFRDYCLRARWCMTAHCSTSAGAASCPLGDDRVISRSLPTAWPPRSPDLNQCGFWLCKFLKDRVYGGSIRTLSEFKANINVMLLQLTEKPFAS